MATEQLTRLEEELRRVPGVRHARVAGDGEPSEIHIVASRERSPKQLVRDVQSLASAGFGMPIDHRIVSIVQLEDEDAREAPTPSVTSAPTPAAPRRAVLDRVILVTKAGMSWIKVVLEWPDGSTSDGLSTAERSRDARARSAVVAGLQALASALDEAGATVEIQHVLLQRAGADDSVMVRGTHSVGGAVTQVAGSAIVHDDVSTAAVHALLQALNRKLS